MVDILLIILSIIVLVVTQINIITHLFSYILVSN